ncbi:MAG: IPT/TIG domain-containing protein, partial [Dehalococcoidia bacterium]
STKGSHTIDASGDTTDDGDVDDLTFSVLPGISITPTSGYAGEEIDITGTGFANNENNIKVTFGGKVVGEDIDADDEGNWSTSIVVPPATNGDHVVDAYGNTTVAADVLNSTFTIEPLITIKPREGSVGETIYVEGTGFSGKKDYTVTYGDATVSSSLTTDLDGSFSTSFPAPDNMSGDIKIVATDSEGVTASGVFSMETTAPPVPRIAAPKDGGRVGYIGDVKVTFDWTDVEDPSGVHYELEISTQSNFSTTLLKVTDLNDSQYTLTEAEALSHGEYYWRVRAIDDAGNASDWTQLSMVKVSYVTTKTLIIIICCVIGFIILVSIVPRIVRKVMKMKSTV